MSTGADLASAALPVPGTNGAVLAALLATDSGRLTAAELAGLLRKGVELPGARRLTAAICAPDL